jgi:hypothetical protein
MHSRTLERGDVNERVRSTVVGLDEAETLGVIEKFYGADWHFNFLQLGSRVPDA